jgi:putative peptidoglycan lipid II flippase
MSVLKQRLIKNTMVFIVFTVLSKITGFAREMALAYRFGASAESDIYIVATTIPVSMFMIVGSAISVSYIPILAQCRDKRDRFFSNTINVFTSATAIIAVLAIIISPYIIRALAPGFDALSTQRAVALNRIVFPYIVVICAMSILGGTLQSNSRYAIPASAGIPLNIIIVTTLIFVASRYGINSIGIGILFAGSIQLVMFKAAFSRLDMKYQRVFDLKDKGLKKMLVLFIPVFLELAIWQINIMVDRNLASGLGEGSIAALNYASTLNGFAIGVFVAGVTAALHPELSGFFVDKNFDAIKKLVRRSINTLIIILAPCSAGLMILRNPIVSVLFERGAFDKNAVESTAGALMFYSIGLFFFGARSIMSRTFMALHNSRISLINGTITVTVNICLNLILIKSMGIRGLALASSMSVILSTVIYVVLLKKHIGDFGIKNIAGMFARALISSGIMSLCVYYIHKMLLNVLDPGMLPLFLCIISAVLIYIASLKLLSLTGGERFRISDYFYRRHRDE